MVKECRIPAARGESSARDTCIPFSGCITSVRPTEDVPLPVFPTAAHRGPQRIVCVPFREGEMLHLTYAKQGKTLCGKACHPDDILRTPVEQWRTWPASWCDRCGEFSQE